VVICHHVHIHTYDSGIYLTKARRTTMVIKKNEESLLQKKTKKTVRRKKKIFFSSSSHIQSAKCEHTYKKTKDEYIMLCIYN